MSDDDESGGGLLGDVEGLGDITGGLGEGLEGVSGLLDEGSEEAGIVDGITEGLAGLDGMLGGGEGEGGEGEKKEKGGGGGLVGGIAGGLAGGAEKLSEMLGEGEDTKDLRAVIDTAGGIAEGVKAGAEVADTLGKLGGALSGGDIGKSASGIGDALGGAGAGVGAITGALGEVVPEELRDGFREASKVANSVGQIARGVGQLVEGVSDLLEDLLGQRQEVKAHLSVAGEDVQWHVRSAHFSDAVGALTSCSVDARAPKDSALDEEELLSKAAHLSLERGDERRSIRGIIREAHVSRRAEHTAVHLEIVPAAWTLTQIVDSRIYQDVSVPDLVEQIMREGLDGQRAVRKDLTETYKPHEYLVQYRESPWAFIRRLCDEEGIFLYFDHDEGEEETLVLADTNDNRPVLREAHEGKIPYEQSQERIAGREVAYGVHRHRRMGPTDAAVKGYDWTNPALNVEKERKGRGHWSGPALEVYDHHHAVEHHDYNEGGGSYQSHTADRASRHQTERLDLARQGWRVETTVVTAKPAHVFELTGTDEHDARYMITSVMGQLTTGEHGGELATSMDVIPSELPYRPPLPARPIMPGPETATVVGPAGEEIHTDKHGRIKVQFHWDRRGQRNEQSSAWIRVAQGWAGTGWGFMFIPRIGMEVIVSFLGGDPDRPIVTGCVYNGTNTPPYALPDDKTKSTIKTNSSLGSGGFNELRFEDKAGKEEVYIHAQRDFNETVKRNHSTSVKANQSISVGGNQSETVGKDQTVTVKKDQKITVKENRTKIVERSESQSVGGHRSRYVTWDENITIAEHQNITVQNGHRSLTVGCGTYRIETAQTYSVAQNRHHKIVVNNSIGLQTPNNVDVSGDGSVKLASNGLVVAEVGASSITLTPSQVIISSPSIILVSGTPVVAAPAVMTPTVIYSGGAGAGGGGAGVVGDGESGSNAERLSPEDQRALEGARCSDAVYTDKDPAGFHRVPGMKIDLTSGLRMILYQSNSDPSRYILAYAGTEDFRDGVTDFVQGVGLPEAQYLQSAVATDRLRSYVEEQGGTLELTGHSLGGGLAAYNGARTGLPTTTFNAAGVHPNTLAMGGAPGAALGLPQSNIINYSAPDDPLTREQESGVASRMAPDALGRQRTVIPRNPDGSVVRSDGTSHHAIAGISRGIEQGGSTSRRRGLNPPSVIGGLDTVGRLGRAAGSRSRDD